MGYVKKGQKMFWKRAIAGLLMIVMAANMWICPALAQENSVSDEGEIKTVLAEQSEEFIELGEAQTSAQPIGFFSLADGIVELNSGNYKDWIDRLDLSKAQVIKDFYDALVEASDNDGENDRLIDDAYFAEDFCYIEVGTEELEMTPEEYSESNVNAFVSAVVDSYSRYIYAAYSAFDRDHPEVFWMSGRCMILRSSELYTMSQGGVPVGYKSVVKVYFCTKYIDAEGAYDVRSTNYPNQAAIEAAIDQRDSMVNEYLTAVTAKNDYEKLVYFNQELTKKNEYNTSDDLDNIDHDCRECVSALEGRTGTVGPVCEAYARALKVLCDRSNIDCVLVDGTAISNSGSGAHMWNYVKLNDKWYGVDVTWNDPTGGASGAVSGVENTNWLLVGSETIVNGNAFLTSHPVSNTVFSESIAFTNGPVLSTDAYDTSEKLYVTPTFSSLPALTGVYGQTVEQMTINGATTSDNGVVGTWALASSGTNVPEVGTTEAYTLTFTPEDTETYRSVSVEVIPQVSRKPITVTVSNKSKTYGEVNPEFSLAITDGTLVGTDSLDDFEIAYECAATEKSVPGNYEITATVSNANYDVTVIPGQLTIMKLDAPAIMPQATYTVHNTVKKVSEVSLPENWKWNDEDALRTLPAGSLLEVTAEYTGADAECYTNTTKNVTITRAACEAGDVLYTGNGEKAPTCTEDGIGHKECTICGDTMNSGIVVDAKGHQTTKTERVEATEEATGREAYWTCDVCEKNFSDSEGNTEVEDLSELDIPKIVKIIPTFATAAAIRGDYGQKLIEMELDVQATSEEGAEGAWTFAEDENTSVYPEVGSEKSYTLVFTPQDTETYKTISVEVVPKVSRKPITVTISDELKTYGEVNPEFSLAITGGTLVGTDSLGDFEIAYGCAATEKSAPGNYEITATVESANYKVTVIPGQLTVDKADTPKNAPDSSCEVENTVKKVSEVSLPENWKWNAEDASKTLPAGSSLEVTAEYAGADVEYYKNTTKAVTITRASCEAGDVLYTGNGEKAPTCTEDGIGHKECKFCGEMMEENVVVPATNHVGTQEVRGAKDATCEETGYTGDVYCFVCDELLETGSVIQKTEKHTCGKENAQTEHKPEVVKPLPPAGTSVPDPKGEASYKVSETGKEVEYTGSVNKKAKKVVIPPTITVNGVTYKVTSIAPNAFKGNKKLTTVTIGSNVESIGNKAFYKCTSLKKITIPSGVSRIGKQVFFGCKKLKTITIKSTALTSKNVGSKAFKGIHSKAKFKVPKAKLKEYKKLLKKKGATKKHKIMK